MLVIPSIPKTNKSCLLLIQSRLLILFQRYRLEIMGEELRREKVSKMENLIRNQQQNSNITSSISMAEFFKPGCRSSEQKHRAKAKLSYPISVPLKENSIKIENPVQLHLNIDTRTPRQDNMKSITNTLKR